MEAISATSVDEHVSGSTELALECESLREFYGKAFFGFQTKEDGLMDGLFIGAPTIPSICLVSASSTIDLSADLVVSPPPKACPHDTSLLTYFVKHLPPMFVHFCQVNSEPSADIYFSLRCSWLDDTHLEAVEKQLSIIYAENPCSPLSSCCGFVEHEMLAFLFPPTNHAEDGDISFANEPIEKAYVKLKSILDHNEYVLREIVPDKMYECDVCATSDLGKKFLRFVNCGHLFCRTCIKAGLITQVENHLNDGKPTCLTCNKEAAQFEMRAVLPKVIYQRYEDLLLAKSLSQMSDVSECPRPGCYHPVLLTNPDLGECPKCELPFCPKCRRTYHAPAYCQLLNYLGPYTIGEILEKFQGENNQERKDIIMKFGEENLQRILSEYLSNIYLKEKSQPCPSCSVPVQRLSGCNLMRCMLCNVPFCWLCGKRTGNEGYDHFSRGYCDGQLFTANVIDEPPNDD